MTDKDFTAQEYSTWLITTMTQFDDGPEFNLLQEQFNIVHAQLDHLHNCFNLPPHETRRRL